MKPLQKPFAVCIDDGGNEASLILGKVYRVRSDIRASQLTTVFATQATSSWRPDQNACKLLQLLDTRWHMTTLSPGNA